MTKCNKSIFLAPKIHKNDSERHFIDGPSTVAAEWDFWWCSRLTWSTMFIYITPRGYRNRGFLVALSHLIVRRPNLEKYQDRFIAMSRMKVCPYVSLENSVDSYLCFRLALLHAVSYFFFLYWSPSSLCMVFDSMSSNIDEVLSINPSANVFVFGDFNVHHKDWLTYSGGANRPGELCYNFSI